MRLWVLIVAVAMLGGCTEKPPASVGVSMLTSMEKLSPEERLKKCMALEDNDKLSLFIASRARHHSYYDLDSCFALSGEDFIRLVRDRAYDSNNETELNAYLLIVQQAIKHEALSDEEIDMLDLSRACLHSDKKSVCEKLIKNIYRMR